MKLEEESRRKEAEEFLRWLSPSHQPVEDQLRIVRKQREEGTLDWARKMQEFHAWRTSDVTSANRILWICGTLGVGKSTMAGYYIELLKYSTPAPAIVAFFFCRSKQKGLTKAREIIRTIAYQCFYDNPQARRVLEGKRRISYLTDDTVAIDPLFENLIVEPLRLIQHDVYIILDGLDESDTNAMDIYGTRVQKSEMEVLIDCFAQLPSVRLLLISRPTSIISEVINSSKMIVKRIEKSDNSEDIDLYVEMTVNKSSRLRNYFELLEISPRDYFRERANSIFLWVVIVLRQLEKARSKNIFEQILNEFSEAGAVQIDQLYESMFQKIDEHDRDFVKEILRWQVSDQFTMRELQGAVEWSLNDVIEDFEDFVKVQCGSMLHTVDADSDTPLQLIHETLRSYITARAEKDKFYFIDEARLKCDTLIACLEVLTESKRSSNERFNAFKSYASRTWVDQLRKVIDVRLAPKTILYNIFKFFQSTACKDWINQTLKRHDFDLMEDRREFLGTLAKCPYNVYHFLICWKENIIKDEDTTEQQDDASCWGLEMLKSPAKLGEYIGQACADIWLNSGVTKMAVKPLFLSAIHYYCLRYNLNRCSIVNLRIIAKNGFAALFDWIGKTNDNSASAKYLGLGFAILQMWEEAEPWFRRAMDSDEPESSNIVSEGFVRACLRVGKFSDVIEIVKPLTEISSKWNIYMGIACNAIGDIENAVSAFEAAMNQNWSKPVSYEWITLQLLQIYLPRENWDKVISACEALLESNSSIWWAWAIIKDAYNAKGDTAGVAEIQKRLIESYPDLRIIEGLEAEHNGKALHYLRNNSLEPLNVEERKAIESERRHSVSQMYKPGLTLTKEEGSSSSTFRSTRELL